ncbi:MAG: TipC family immunity protein, partial [Streptococcus mitis]|nr:TipC family immunity protein [Streptococcus mitis]
MKKTLSILALVAIIISSCFYFFIHQPKNIFDEIYQETEKTYRTNNILRNIDGFKISPGWPNDGEYFAYTPSGKYQTHPEGYKDISIGFNFGSGIKGMTILFEKRINSDITLWYSAHYNIKKKVLQKEIAIFEEPRQPGQYLEDEEKIREYLRKYNISKEELEKDYDEIVNQKVLK